MQKNIVLKETFVYGSVLQVIELKHAAERAIALRKSFGDRELDEPATLFLVALGANMIPDDPFRTLQEILIQKSGGMYVPDDLVFARDRVMPYHANVDRFAELVATYLYLHIQHNRVAVAKERKLAAA